MKKFFSILTTIILTLSLVSCSNKNKENTNLDINKKLIIGASITPHAEILTSIKDELKSEGIELIIKEFDEYVLPNLALGDKTLDANYFQHIPYMKAFAKDNNLQLTSLCKVHLEPMALYSKKIKSIDEIKENFKISVPNDPTNLGRALLLLEKHNIIKLKENTGIEATELDIIENPKNIKIQPIDAPSLYPTLDDVDASIINANFAIQNGLNPIEDSIIMEGNDSEYANIITVRTGDENKEIFKKLIKVIQSEKTKEFINKKYKGAIIATF